MVPSDVIKKKLADEKKQKDEEMNQRQKALEEENNKKQKSTEVRTPEPDEEKIEKEDKQQWQKLFKLIKHPVNTPEVINKINEAFDKAFGEGKRKDGVLQFSSPETAKEFFEGQAKEGLKFISKEVGNDHYFYSDGSGRLFEGTEKELIQHLAKEKQQQFKTILPKDNNESAVKETPLPRPTPK